MVIDIDNQGLYLNDAIKKILEEMDTLIVNNEILHKEEINLDEALGKVSMEEILSAEDMPGYRSSVMDGYALGESTKGNKWKIVGESFPGKPFNDLLKKGEAVTISTGSFVPDNCFSVIPQEQVSLEFLNGNEYIVKKETSSNNSWIREKNDQAFKGEILIKKGVKITPGILSKLASCGIKTIKVSKISKLGLLITGDELIKSGTVRKKGEIWESNSILIKSIAKNLGFEINEIHIEKDNYQNIKNSLRNISEFNDVIFSVGGISVGKKDFLKDRFRYYLKEKEIRYDIIEATLSSFSLNNLFSSFEKAKCLNKVINTQIGIDINSSYKRASNILDYEMKNKEIEINDTTDPGIFKSDFEKNLYKKINDIKKYYSNINSDENFEKSLSILAETKKEVFEFFDNVKVNEDNETLRKNRLELMQLLCKTFNNYLNFSDIESA